ncbi:MAG: ABC transporter ATP-binding protein [Solimonas sp.]
MERTDPLAGPRASKVAVYRDPPAHAHEAGLEARGPVRVPLEVQGLSTTLFTRRGEMKAVDGLSLAVGVGETVALVGESGCGKSLSALSIMRLLPDPPARIVGGAVKLNGRDIVPVAEEAMLDIRGKEIGMIFQDPMSSLNPVTTVGKQIAEVLTTHTELGGGQARTRAHELLELVGMPDAGRRLDAYPHQLSGGMCQRVMIAMAIACRPSVLIADEPTTALDVTVQAQVLALLKRLQADAGMAMIFITHDLGVVAETADRVVVMYAGRKVEEASVDELFENPLHPYTAGLIGATPVPGAARADRLADIPGMVPPLNALPQGCAFAPRCPRVMERCWREKPHLTEPAPGRQVACFAAERG